jgi:hypothetical protein
MQKSDSNFNLSCEENYVDLKDILKTDDHLKKINQCN